jgi:hypothetical protein
MPSLPGDARLWDEKGRHKRLPYHTTKLRVWSKPTGRWRPWRSTAIPHLAVVVEGEGQSGPLVGCGAKGWEAAGGA